MIKIVLRDATGRLQTLFFTCEDLLVEALKETYTTHAPVEFTYADGRPIERALMERIQQRLFSS